MPEQWIRREWRGNYKGQKQIWYLLRLTGGDHHVQLRASAHPEFDAWRWSEYWVPLETVVEFKRNVYQMALTELEPFLNADRLRHPAIGRRGRRLPTARAAAASSGDPS